MNVRKWLARLDDVVPADTRVTVSMPDRLHALSGGEVRKPETRDEATGQPVRHGLLCTQIFGPEQALECSCGKSRELETVCPSCGDTVLAAPARDTTFGHVDLVTPVVHPWLASLTASALGWTDAALKQVLAGEWTVDAAGAPMPGEEEGDAATKSGPELVLEALQRTKSPLLADPMTVMVRTVLVLPPGLRPGPESDANDLYRRLINRNNRLRRLRELAAPHIIIRNEARMLQQSIDAAFDNEWQGGEPAPGMRRLRSLGSMALEALRREPADQTALRCLGFELSQG